MSDLLDEETSYIIAPLMSDSDHWTVMTEALENRGSYVLENVTPPRHSCLPYLSTIRSFLGSPFEISQFIHLSSFFPVIITDETTFRDVNSSYRPQHVFPLCFEQLVRKFDRDSMWYLRETANVTATVITFAGRYKEVPIRCTGELPITVLAWNNRVTRTTIRVCITCSEGHFASLQSFRDNLPVQRHSPVTSTLLTIAVSGFGKVTWGSTRGWCKSTWTHLQ